MKVLIYKNDHGKYEKVMRNCNSAGNKNVQFIWEDCKLSSKFINVSSITAKPHMLFLC